MKMGRWANTGHSVGHFISNHFVSVFVEYMIMLCDNFGHAYLTYLGRSVKVSNFWVNFGPESNNFGPQIDPKFLTLNDLSK